MKTPPGEKERRGGKGVGKGGGKEKPMSYAAPSPRGGGGEVGGEVGLGVDCNGNGGNGTGGFGDFGNGDNGGNGNGGKGPGVGGKKEKKEEDTESVGSDGKRKRSRSELNEIEKERMSRISQLIGCLHNLLEDSGLTCKKSKQVILEKSKEYIKVLQNQLELEKAKNVSLSTELEIMHQQIATVASVNNAILVPPNIFDLVGSQDDFQITRLVDDVDYSLLFHEATLAMAISSLDGRFLRCNAEFCRLSGYSQEELQAISFFSLTPAHEVEGLFSVISSMFASTSSQPKKFWKQCNMKNGTVTVYVSMSLIRDLTGTPKYFQCIVLPIPDLKEMSQTSMTCMTPPQHTVHTEVTPPPLTLRSNNNTEPTEVDWSSLTNDPFLD